jgi:hypothetical protein
VGVFAELIGGDEVKAKLDRMDKAAVRAQRNAVRRGATVQTQAIRRNLKRRRTGLLAKSIGNKVKESKNGARSYSVAGPRRGFKVKVNKVEAKRLEGVRNAKGGDKKIVLKGGSDVKAGQVLNATRYAHLVEKQFPFMRPAFESTKAEVERMILEAGREAMRA